MDNNEKELMDELKGIVDNAQGVIDREARIEADGVVKDIFSHMDREFADENDCVLMYVANVDPEVAVKEYDENPDVIRVHNPNANIDDVRNGTARAAKASVACPPLSKEKLSQMLQDETAVMLLHGWANPIGLIAFVRNDDGSTLKVAALPTDLIFEIKSKDGDDYRHYDYNDPIPESVAFGGEDNMEMVKRIVTAAQEPRQLKQHYGSAYDALMDKCIERARQQMKENGIDPDNP